MDASGDSGFKWILARLGDDVRTRYCSQALHEELADVQTQLSMCCEAMAHAKEVGAAIASLEAAQDTSIRPQSVVALLSELHALQRSCQRQMAALRQPFTDTPSSTSTSGRKAKKEKSKLTAIAVPAVVAEEEEEEDQYANQRKLLSKVQSIMSKRRRATWLSDAVDVLREFVKSAPIDEATEHKGLSKHAKNALKDWKKFTIRALKALRTAVLEEAAEQEEQPPRFLKALRKLTKRNGDLTGFYEESEELVTAKEKEITAKKAKKKKSEKDAKKKRKLSDASTISSVAVSAPEAKKAPPVATGKPEKKLAIAESRVLLTRCAKEIKLLRDKFTNELFNQNLNHLEDVAFSLSSEFTYNDVSSLLSSLFAVVEHVEKVKQPVKRKNRLMRLEVTLQVLVDTTTIPISNRRREMAQEYLVNCQKSLKQIQTHPEENSSVKTDAHVPDSSASKSKKFHDVVAQQAKKVKHESSTPAAPKMYQQNYHPAIAQVQSKKKKETLTMGGHVHF